MKTIIALLVLVVSLSGQNSAKQIKIQGEVQIEKGKLHEQEALERRLIQLRIRHNLGLPTSSLAYTRMTEDEKNTVEIGGNDTLRNLRGEVDRLEAEEQRLSSQLGEKMRSAGPSRLEQALSRSSEAGIEQMFPKPAGETAGMDTRPEHSMPVRSMPVRHEPDPIDEKRPEESPASEIPLGPRVHVRASLDRSAIGRNKVRYAAKLLNTGAASGTIKAVLEDARRELLMAVTEWDQKSKKLDVSGFAVPSLEEVTVTDGDSQSVRDGKHTLSVSRAKRLARRETVLGSLLYLGKCEEQLAALAPRQKQGNTDRGIHLNAANTYYSAVVAADSPADKDPGKWAIAADAAQKVNDWENKNGGWRVNKIERDTRTPASNSSESK